MKQVEFVVAHYNEDLSWLSEVQASVSVYTKGTPATHITPLRHTILPNIGREGHTYLHHIITYYNDLPEVVVFVQGRVDDHVNINALQMMDAAAALESNDVLTFPPEELERFDTWNGKHLDLYPADFTWLEEILREPKKCIAEAPMRPEAYFKRFIGRGGLPLSIAWQPGAIFAVPRELIHRHPRSLYQDLLGAIFGGTMATNDPEAGHFLEKFWLALWKPEEYVCWKQEEISQVERNAVGHLARGRWKVRISCIRNDPMGNPPMPPREEEEASANVI